MFNRFMGERESTHMYHLDYAFSWEWHHMMRISQHNIWGASNIRVFLCSSCLVRLLR